MQETRSLCKGLLVKKRLAVKTVKRRVQSRQFCYFCRDHTHLKRNCRLRARILKKSELNNCLIISSVDLVKVKGKIFNRDINFLVDTGAGISLIHSKFIKNKKSIISSDYVQVKSASGHNLWILGKVKIDFTINSLKFSHTFFVIKNFDLDAILGNDFNSRHGVNINFLTRSMQLHTGGKSAIVHFQTKENTCEAITITQTSPSCVLPCEQVVLPPMTTQKVKIRYSAESANFCYFQPNYQLFRNNSVITYKRSFLLFTITLRIFDK